MPAYQVLAEVAIFPIQLTHGCHSPEDEGRAFVNVPHCYAQQHVFARVSRLKILVGLGSVENKGKRVREGRGLVISFV